MSNQRFVTHSARIAITASIAALAFAIPAALSAQSQGSQLDARWQPWIGCWRPAPPMANGAAAYGAQRNNDVPLVCIVPGNDANAPSSVEVVTIAQGKIVAQDTIVADGRSIARSKDHCQGDESASWSADGHRLYVASDYTCPGGIKRTSSGLFAISPTGDWVNVQGVNANGNKGVTTLRYSDVGRPADLPPELAQALNGNGLEVSTARAAASARLTTADVVEASHRVDASVVQAWIIDRGQSFDIDAKQLVALADAGVPGSVTDAMVAVSYPRSFAVNPEASTSDERSVDSASTTSGTEVERSTGRNIEVMMMPAYSPYYDSPFGYGPYAFYGFGYPGYGYSAYGYAPYAYGPYGGYYSPYAVYPLGYGGIVYPSRPVIVLRGQPAPRGYVVRGHGYSQSAPSSAGSGAASAQPRSNVAPPPRRSAPSEPSSSGHTAHQRP